MHDLTLHCAINIFGIDKLFSTDPGKIDEFRLFMFQLFEDKVGPLWSDDPDDHFTFHFMAPKSGHPPSFRVVFKEPLLMLKV